jgi:glycosyltransferase involved in cell wall biosynthesis
VRALKRDLSRHAGVARFVVGSDYMRGHVVAHGVPGERVVHLPLFTPPPSGTRLHPLRIPGRLLYVGALNRGKGVELLVRALRDLPGWITATLVGEGPDRVVLEEAARHHLLAGRVTFTGRLPAGEVEAHMRHADLLVIPSRTPETFSLVGVEAARLELPSVAADVGGIRDWLLDGETGELVPPNDADALRATLLRLLGDRPLLRRMGRAARERAEARFTLETHLGALDHLLREVAA